MRAWAQDERYASRREEDRHPRWRSDEASSSEPERRGRSKHLTLYAATSSDRRPSPSTVTLQSVESSVASRGNLPRNPEWIEK